MDVGSTYWEEFMLTRRRVLTLAAASALAPIAATSVAQQRYPSKPITLIVSYAAGGGTDAVARIFAARLEQVLDGRVIVENRPGAAANLGTEAVAAAAPDGYTLLIGNQGPMVVNPHLFKRLKADPATTLDPIALIADAGLLVVVGPRLPVTSMGELVAEAKKRQLVYGSAGNASASHLAVLLLGQVAGFEARHVPYRGAGPALNDLVGGHIDFMITTIPSAVGLVEGKKLTALAVTTEQRFASLPDLPTAIEAGVKGYTASAWYGLLGPKGLPAAIREQLERATTETLRDPNVLNRLKDDGAIAAQKGSRDFAAFMAQERTRWGEIVRAANITLD
jgi:tripartite-type tricarboxylate transporter receptor subunit TctC